MHLTRQSSSLRRSIRTICQVIIFGAIAGVMAGCNYGGTSPSPLDPASPAARSIANLHTVTLVIATIVFLIVCGLLIYSLIRFRRKSADDPEPDQSFHGNTTLEVSGRLSR